MDHAPALLGSPWVVLLVGMRVLPLEATEVVAQVEVVVDVPVMAQMRVLQVLPLLLKGLVTVERRAWGAPPPWEHPGCQK